MIVEPRSGGFRHEALLYASTTEFLERAVPFIEHAVSAGEAILVAVGKDKIRRLRTALNGSARRVVFADMADIGANPARIIPLWADFVGEHGVDGACVWGIGEPIWAGRSPVELVECQLHESLLNLAFADAAGFTLVCPYDTSSLTTDVVEEALHSHPCVRRAGASHTSGTFSPTSWLETPFDQPLPEPEAAIRIGFDRKEDLARIRHLVASTAAERGASADRQSTIALAVHEAAANSLVHGGGSGNLRIWSEGNTLICEVQDRGRIRDPMVGRVRPSSSSFDGRGMWLIQQLADLAQVRSNVDGTTVRIHVSI